MLKKIKYLSGSIVIIYILISFTFCKDNYTPKPPGYVKIEYPEKKYKLFDSFPAFRFEYPEYAFIGLDSSIRTQPGWFNVDFPSFNGTIFLSYKTLDNNLGEYIEDCRQLAYKHTIKAETIDEIMIRNPDNKVFGIFYEIKGNVASSVQFFVTDSIRHFLRGSLYFNTQPNQDSLSPLINFVRKDIDHLIETLEWK